MYDPFDVVLSSYLYTSPFSHAEIEILEGLHLAPVIHVEDSLLRQLPIAVRSRGVKTDNEGGGTYSVAQEIDPQRRTSIPTKIVRLTAHPYDFSNIFVEVL